MNERQANTQHKLSKGRSLGQDSSSAYSDTENIQTNTEGEKKISKAKFIMMIAVGLILDIIGLIPFLGWLFSSVVLILIYYKLGVKFHLKNILKFGSCDLIKLIPIISIIPTFTLAVILNIGPMVEGVEDMIPGGEGVVHKVQKAMSMTKK